MEKQILKTTLTVEFAPDENHIADVLAFIAAARNGSERVRHDLEGKEPEHIPRPDRRIGNVTRDDIRDLMAELIESDDTRPKVLKRLKAIGAKSVGTIKNEDVADFYDFLQSLKETLNRKEKQRLTVFSPCFSP